MSVSTTTNEVNGHGQRLRSAREAAGLDIATVAQRLRMPVRVVEALESDDWSRLGAPVFIRGQLRSYARLMRLPTHPFDESVGSPQLAPAALVPRTRTPPLQRIADQVGGRLVYIVITALIVLPIWVATQTHVGDVGQTVSLDGNPVVAPSPNAPGAPAGDRRPAPATVVASMASLPPRHSSPASSLAASNLSASSVPALRLKFSGDSWVRILAADGSIVEEALLRDGDERSYPLGQLRRLTLGNAAAVEVRAAGDVQDMTPYLRSNVARFTVSSDGSLQPANN